MKRNIQKGYFLCLMLIVSISQLYAADVFCQLDSISYSENDFCFSIRYGQGGYSDSRSPLDKLGGGQLAIDIKPRTIPLALSISSEYYTNSNEPSQPYEIADLIVFNCFYTNSIFNSKRVNVFAGAGIGRMNVALDIENREKALLFDAVAGINTLLFWKIGIYGSYKYLYAKEGDLINFSEHIILIGISFNFGL